MARYTYTTLSDIGESFTIQTRTFRGFVKALQKFTALVSDPLEATGEVTTDVTTDTPEGGDK